MIKRTMTAGCLLLALGACRNDGAQDTAPAVPDAPGTAPTAAAPTFAPQLNVDLDAMQRTPSGLYVQDVREGSGQPAQPGDRVAVHYTGWLPDGREFDSSRPRGEPFVFGLGQGEVIRGWDEGVAGMRPNGQRRLVIPPDLAYGASGAGGVIPPNATLVFDVELLEIR
jgi:FKBP-type peptidyl-prolyl cis-trans isomerase